MTRPRLLDLFCGAGGASAGYAAAGFDVTGVDIEPHPDYPFTFQQGDAMEVLADSAYLDTFDVVAASPPCQQYTRAGHLARAQTPGWVSDKPDLLEPVVQALRGRLFVIENVPGAPFPPDLFTLTLCGSSFGLAVRRHRVFAAPVLLMGLPCRHAAQGRPVGVYGRPDDDIPAGGRTARTLDEGQAAMGIDWMQWHDLKEAIPPAYTQYLGEQLIHA